MATPTTRATASTGVEITSATQRAWRRMSRTSASAMVRHTGIRRISW
jgi:hypothetical protein